MPYLSDKCFIGNNNYPISLTVYLLHTLIEIKTGFAAKVMEKIYILTGASNNNTFYVKA